MSLRIQNDAASGISSPDVHQSGHVSQSGASGSGKAGGTSGSHGGDHVEVSSVASSISEGVSAQGAQQAARVKQLGALYANGSYNVDSTDVSRAIVSHATRGITAGKA